MKILIDVFVATVTLSMMYYIFSRKKGTFVVDVKSLTWVSVYILLLSILSVNINYIFTKGTVLYSVLNILLTIGYFTSLLNILMIIMQLFVYHLMPLFSLKDLKSLFPEGWSYDGLSEEDFKSKTVTPIIFSLIFNLGFSLLVAFGYLPYILSWVYLIIGLMIIAFNYKYVIKHKIDKLPYISPLIWANKKTN